MSDFIWAPPPELVEQANVTRLARRLGAAGYHDLHRISIEEPDRFWPAVVDDLGIEFSQPWELGGRRLPRPRVGDVVHRRPGQHRPCLPAPVGGSDAEALVGLYEDGGRESLTWSEASRAGDAARRGARRARRRGGRPRRDLHADVPRRRRRLARVRARRRGAGSDLLGLRRARDRVAARGLAGEGRHLRRLVAAPRQADGDARDPRRCGQVRGRARRSSGAARRARGPSWSTKQAGDAASAGGRERGAVPARVHVRHDREAEGRAARAGRLPRLDRARGRLPGGREGGRPHPLRHRHGLDHGAVDGGRRRRRRRGDRLRRGRARLAARPAVAARRVGARDDARALADARARIAPARRPRGRPLVAARLLHHRRAVEPGPVPLARSSTSAAHACRS